MRRPTKLVAASGLILGALAILLMPARLLFLPPVQDDAGREVGVRWACAMMDYVSDLRGNGICPVCGMKLERITAGALSAEQQRRMQVETTTVTRGPARVTIRAYGAARYDERTRTTVLARVTGRVVKRYAAALHHGTLVEQGDPIVDLSSPMALASQAELAAAVALKDERLISALRERFARWNLVPLADRIIAGQPATDLITITSPAAGLVANEQSMTGERDDGLPQIGAEVAADRPLITLVDPDAFMIVVHVPEAQARFLRLDQAARIASDDAGDLSDVHATVSWLAPELSLETRTREIHLHVSGAGRRLFAGSLVSARIEAVLGPDLLPADPARPDTWGAFLLVPKSAILSTGVRQVAWRTAQSTDDKQSFTLAPVALGPRLEDPAGDDRYVVRAGLDEGDVVATQGAFLIDSQAQLVGSPSLLFPDGAVAPAAHAH